MSGKGNNPREAAGGATVPPKETAEIDVAGSAASRSPPPVAVSKLSTPVGQTPTTRTKRKKIKGTPSTPAFQSKKKNAKTHRRVKKDAPKEDLETAKVERALKLFKRTTKSTSVTVNNTMWLFLSECERVEGSDDIVFLQVPVNHNCVNSKVAHEITNNILGNPVHADLANKFHEPNMGTDMHCLLTYNTKVSLCPSSLSSLLVNVKY